MRFLITGSRRWRPITLAPRIVDDILALAREGERVTIIHGGAPGADTAADLAADVLGANLYRYPAEWDYYAAAGSKKAAGPLRNAQMLNEMPPDVVLAYPLPTSKGTWQMVDLATKRGFEVVVRHFDERSGTWA